MKMRKVTIFITTEHGVETIMLEYEDEAVFCRVLYGFIHFYHKGKLVQLWNVDNVIKVDFTYED